MRSCSSSPFTGTAPRAILKEWQDAALAHGFAYGTGGDKLRGKKLLVATTTGGGTTEAYQAGGYNHYTLSELLRPFQATGKHRRDVVPADLFGQREA